MVAVCCGDGEGRTGKMGEESSGGGGGGSLVWQPRNGVTQTHELCLLPFLINYGLLPYIYIRTQSAQLHHQEGCAMQ